MYPAKFKRNRGESRRGDRFLSPAYVFCRRNAERAGIRARRHGTPVMRPAINQIDFFRATIAAGHGMVMKTGGRYRRDNIPRGRVSRSRRCQRRQARPRRRRIVAAKPTLPRIPRILSLSVRDHTLRVPPCPALPPRAHAHGPRRRSGPLCLAFTPSTQTLGNTDNFRLQFS